MVDKLDDETPTTSSRDWNARKAEHCTAHYVEMIGAIRGVADRLGYAIGVHGSLARDIDLIAVPWTQDCETAERLAKGVEAIAHAFIPEHMRHPTQPPTARPHGRLTWTIHLEGGPWIDLSVMPRCE